MTKLLSGLFALGLAVSSFFLNSAWNTITEIRKDVATIRIEEAGHYTKAEALERDRSEIAKDSVSDRAIMRLEENMTIIKESLLEIKANNTRFEKKLDLMQERSKPNLSANP